ncbi:MAG TPA: shikimate kinase [Aquimonas sp.]|jgi:shikimate kinase|nr:shikimate kinase [Xanthomonadales bacterium]HRD71771.1 shikimate kinase [Aquimonas sp.]HRF54075.1 shikimate kinase [Aquimonas sp.]
MNPASNLILIGPMGAGKSTIGKRLAKRFGLAFFDADQEIERQAGASINVIFEMEGEGLFRRREFEALTTLCSQSDCVIATGGGAVLLAQNRDLLRRSGFVVYLRTSVEQQLQRLRHDTSRPLLATPDRDSRLQEMARVRGPLYRETADLVFESDQAHASQAADRLCHVLNRRWKREQSSGTVAQ